MRRLLLVAVALVLVVAAVFLSWATRATPHIRDHVVAALNTRFASQVALDSLQVAVFPRPAASGTGLTLRHNGRTDVPPLITIGEFEAGAGVFGLIGTPVHLRNVMLDRLDIRVPVGGLGSDQPDVAPPPGAVATAGTPSPTMSADVLKSIVIDEIVTKQARLEIASGKPGRLPRIFDIDNLVISGFSPTAPARFSAGIDNPIPRGHIDTRGSFGPWDATTPERTSVSGDYTFKDADLDVIKGIGGILSSVGRYSGVLERLVVEGTTDTPDFSIDIAGQKVPLTTAFRAIVDGTNGDTYLDRVEAKLAQTTILAKGAVVRTEDVKGRKVSLDVRITNGHLEDLMRLAVATAKPPLTGRIDLQTSFLLPAGEQDVVDRLRLKGMFNLAQARFSNFDVQKKVNVLSRRGKGDETADGTGPSVVSNLRGRFQLRNATLDFDELQFAVPGAVVQLAGSYKLHGEEMNFSGDLLMDASLADMTSGFKSVLARLAQPFFRKKGGGSRLPIKITGTRAQPSFGLDIKRVFHRGDDADKMPANAAAKVAANARASR